MPNWETIQLEKNSKAQGVYTLTLNRPQSMNALNTQMAIDLVECLKQLNKDKECRVLVITGSGERAFCVGADLKERNGMTKEAWRAQHDIFEEAFMLIRDFPYPVIAAINGYALGGGMEMILNCDLRVAAAHAKFGLPEATLGIIPGVGGTQLLPRAVPVTIAKEILFSGKQFTAERGKEIGLLNEVAESGKLMETAYNLAASIAKNAPLSLQNLKKAINNGLQTDITTALTIELQAYYQCADSEDRLEGVLAFNEKRQPNWQGK
ncbi:enoyl-CoA hydratase [Pueribacillus theae]|uniref:Enoyl-CoA hydratase n=1 Tax=Pueribacillus theae TaxID=2171751 RepID=A0A2U1JSE5_9BACI|nr:enoyl-CoA hydratase-related protein [Pueribacillus theae]PWA08127.1 enoyl-CoA hydratase [Pueribacillus theae]